MARSLNKVQLIGNLTRDPELRYTPNGNAVCSFSLATNRNWTTDTGEKREEVDFHKIIAWNKLAELCSQFLVKGRKVYVEGRLTTRSWTGQDGTQKSTTEVVISDMILLDRGAGAPTGEKAAEDKDEPREESAASAQSASEPVKEAQPSHEASTDAKAMEDKSAGEVKSSKKSTKSEPKEEEPAAAASEEEVMPDDIPF